MLGFSWAYVTDATDFLTTLKAKLVDAGWAQLGTSDVYQTAKSDQKGNLGYVRFAIDGTGPRVYSSTFLNSTSDGLLHDVSRATSVSSWNKMWHFYIYDLWFYCFEVDLPNNTHSFLGAGLYKPLPNSTMWDVPSFVYAGNGTNRGPWLSGSGDPNLAGRCRYTNGEIWYWSPGVMLAGTTHNFTGGILSSVSSNIQMGGGLFVMPALLWTQVEFYSLLGSPYNTVILGGMGWLTDIRIPCGSRFTYGQGRVFEVPHRPTCHADGAEAGASVAFQVEGF